MPESRRSGDGRVVAVLFSAFLVFCVAPVREAAAHAALDQQIADLTKRIEANPSNADLFIRRGQIHRAHRDFRAAASDYERARKLSPDLRAVDLYLGQVYLDADRADRALTYLDRFLERDPSNEEGRAERGRALVMLGAPLEASLDFTCAVQAAARRGDPPPEYYLDRAQAQSAAGGDHLEEALSGLDEGIARLGPVVTLELAALDLELSLGRPQAALERLDRIASQSQRKESFLFQRGEILEHAGQLSEACASYQCALEAMETLPPWKQRTAAMAKLRLGLNEALERMSGGEPSPTDR